MFRRRMIAAAITTMLVAAGSFGGAVSAGAQEDEKVITIGVLAPLDAGLTDFGLGIRNSVQLAVDQANEKDQLEGWTIEVVPVDDSSDPATGVANVPTLIDDPSVLGVVGTYNSGVAADVLPLLEAANLAMISPGNTLASLTLGEDQENPERQFDNYFRLVASDADQAPFLAKRVKKLGAKTVAVVSETKAVSQGLADAFVAAFEDGGGTVSLQQTVPDGATDFTDFLNAAKEESPDMIVFGGEYQVAATLRIQATEAGLDVPLVGGDGIKDDAFIADAADASDGTLASTVGVPAEKLKTAKKFLAAYEDAGFEEAPSDFGPYAYDAANMLIGVLEDILGGQDEIPADAREQVIDAIQAFKGKGATGKIAFDKYGDTKNVVFTLYRVEDGEWTPV
jgi:branched-chain amino acid transport system substrate-binding protein